MSEGKISMITTVSLNTSLDHTYMMEAVKVGEVNRVQKCIQTAGGKGLNVARVVDLCGEEVQCIGTAGGYTGRRVMQLLDELKIKHRFVQTTAESRKCINILDQNYTSTELLEPGNPITEKELRLFKQAYEQIIKESNVIILSGSVPRNVSHTIYKELIEQAKEQNVKVILDTSDELLQEGIKALPTIVKPNQDEISSIMGKENMTFSETVEAAHLLQQRGIEIVVISLGKDGALFATEKGIYHAKPPEIKPLNTVGSGDSMVAALAVGLIKDLPREELIRYAIAVSAANALSEKTGDFNEQDMQAIWQEVSLRKIDINTINKEGD